MEWCGRHARSTKPVRWTDVRRPDFERILLIQAQFRGWSVRRRLALAGPGVLSRERCVNDEDVFTLEDKRRVSPLDYFAWEESGKIWWFQIPTVLQMCRSELHPTNPYTKTPIPMEARCRLRRILCDRIRRKRSLYHTPVPPQEGLWIQQVRLCQTLEEQGFDDFHPEHWNALSRGQLEYFLERLIQIFRGWALEPPHRPWRTEYTGWLRTVLHEARARPDASIAWVVARICNVLLSREIQPYEIAFHVVSAYTQVTAFS